MLFLLQSLRHELHRHPELSGEESATAQRIKTFAAQHHPTQIISGIGGHGLAIVYEFSGQGPCIMIRCELDALPIEETNVFEHRSAYPGISHKCGHDGHMAIVAGLAGWIEEQTFTKGKIVLLFQPAEETGKGAAAVMDDPQFASIQPDYLFALHNLPGEPLHQVIVAEKRFSATVQSLAIHLQGKPSHASEPEKGINPAMAMATITQRFAELMNDDVSSEDFALLTPVYSRMGATAYGISAGEGELHYTIRTWSEEYMQQLKEKLWMIVADACRAAELQFRIDWFDFFPSAINDTACNELIRKAAAANGFAVTAQPVPFKFGEDFGWYTAEIKSAMFGIGAGEDHPALHHADYDFPDELIETGIKIFGSIIKQVLQKNS
jgi:amidohydrolase